MASTDLPSAQLQFLQRDYELRITYLTAHFTRMWQRFNFFVLIESGLATALFALFKDKGVFVSGAVPIASVGVLSSFIWYVFGAQDRYLVAVYRKQVDAVGEIIAEKLRLRDYTGEAYASVGDESTSISRQWYDYVVAWRREPISTTRLAAWFPLFVLLLWIIVLIRSAIA